MSEAPRRTPVLTGGCQCGAVRYAFYALPAETSICHCRMCQKAVGGPFAAFAKIAKADFAWTRGTAATFASSNVAVRDFCQNCGTPLSFRFVDDDAIEVSVGSLDRPQSATPNRQYGMEGRLSWVGRITELPGQTTDAAESAARRARFVCRQHPDGETDPGWRPAHDE